ncbi:MAG: MtrB/PioB family outer membrane beta-barrel protein [Opitutaceae bacterium]|nr:MtrB/PioB family outer membrane beta-barrel protein [Opitutaceae bacterium]
MISRILPLLATSAFLVLPAAASPLADSAVGTSTVLGNAMTASNNAATPRDPEWQKPKHTPTGQMFELPPAVTKPGEAKKFANGWEYSGSIEFGYIGGDADERSAQFRTYSDPGNDAHLNTFNFKLRQPKTGHYVELNGGGAARDDQYYGVEFGRVNDWKVKLYYSEIPHVFTDRYGRIWNGVGSGNLTLLPGLTAGGTANTAADNAAVLAAALANQNTTLALGRERLGARLDVNLWTNWKGYLSYAVEKRNGARPLGSVWGAGGGTAPIEVPEPIEYDTEDILAGLMFADGLTALNVRFSASLFKNNIDTLTFQEPYRIAPPAGVTTTPAAGAYTQGTLDLTPSNTAYNLRAEFTRKLPDFHRGYFSAVVSAGEWRQDDNLIPYTSIPVVLTNVTTNANGGWNTVGALSRRSADQKIGTRLADLTLSLNPSDALNVKLKGRFNETKNANDPYLAVNPNAVYVDADAAAAGNQTRGLTFDGVTGVWGRLINDASGNAVLLGANANPNGNTPIKAPTFDSKQHRFGPTADYRLTKSSTLNASLEREVIERTQRERAKTWEDRAKIGYVNRGLGDSTLRVSYEYEQRRGSEYRASTFDGLFSSAIFPMPTTAGTNVSSWAVRTNTGMRAFDLSDRNRHKGNLRVDTMVRPGLDVGVSLQATDARHPDAAYGRSRQVLRSANLDVSYQPNPSQSGYLFFSQQFGRIVQSTIASANANLTIGLVTPLGTVTPANAIALGAGPGGLAFPLINAWTARNEERSQVFGGGFRQDFKSVSLNADYSRSIGRSRIAYDYTVGGAINAATAPIAGSRMPDLATDVDYLDVGVRVPLSASWAVRLVYRYQAEKIRDWHYYGLATTPVVAGNVANLPTGALLDAGPTNYRVDWYGAMVQLKF